MIDVIISMPHLPLWCAWDYVRPSTVGIIINFFLKMEIATIFSVQDVYVCVMISQ
jgi:hypothetical protein